MATGLAPANLQIVYTGPIPGGLTERSLVLLHTRSGDTQPTPITATCSGTLFSGVEPTGEIPCRRVQITRLPGGIARVEIDAWDVSNGEWRWG